MPPKDPYEDAGFSPLELKAVAAALRPEQRLRNLRRRSFREFDIEMDGIYTDSCGTWGAWLPLAVISAANWCHPSIAELSDYRIMAQEGDWSAIRDSRTESIWRMFDVAAEQLRITQS